MAGIAESGRSWVSLERTWVIQGLAWLAALLARFDAPFPRLPFEKIDKPTYERLVAEVKKRRRTDNFFFNPSVHF